MAIDPEFIIHSEPPSEESSFDAEPVGNVYLPPPEGTRSRALSASQVPLPSNTPVFLTPPPNDPVLVEVTWLPMPLQNNVFVLVQYETSKAVELCGPAIADISKEDFVVSPKGDFVETRISFVALALKKVYDQMYGVRKGVPSPYVISSYPISDGEQLHKISYREPPAASTSPRSISKSSGRLSVHHFIPSVFSSSSQVNTGETTPTIATTYGWNHHSGSMRSKKKLQKKRSITYMTGNSGSRSRSGTTGSYRSSAVTEGSGEKSREGFPIRLYGTSSENVDLLAELLGWDPRSHSKKSSASNKRSADSSPIEASIPRLPTHLSGSPFGEDIGFNVPVAPPREQSTLGSSSNLVRKREQTIRQMHSFDSNLTARAPKSESAEEEEHTMRPVEIDPASSGFRVEIFDALQSLTGIKHREPSSSSDANAPSMDVTPQDDPRFVIWGNRLKPSESPNVELPPARERVIIAASIERWVAQLTSVLDYDELLNFYLTFRTFISATDLCRLLICRFQWSLTDSNSTVDASVRKIVRVRTFIAIRYWLQTFFAVDFLPNRDLRLLFADWLNTAGCDPHIAENPDALIIIDKLRKITQDCRDMHLKKSVYHKEAAQASQSQPHLPLTETPKLPPGLFSTTCDIKSNEERHVDLDLEKHGDMHLSATSNVHSRLDLAQTITPLSLQPGRPSVISETNGTRGATTLMLQQTIHMKILASAQNPASALIPATMDGNAFPQHSAISRAFVSAFGRLGRWRRELNARSRTNPSALACTSGFDVDADTPRSGDLLATKDGLDQYLQSLNIRQEGMNNDGSAQASGSEIKVEPAGVTIRVSEAADGDDGSVLNLTAAPRDQPVNPEQIERILRDDLLEQSSRQSESSIGAASRWHPEVVSLDDYEFSDSDGSGYGEVLPTENGIRRMPKRLPLRRDFELVGRESVSSLGAHSPPPPSVAASRESTTSADSDLAPEGIQPWHLDVMGHSDGEEPGDAEAALRRLEGQIDSNQQRAKERQVEGWLKTVAHRIHRGEGSDYAQSEGGEEEAIEIPDAATPGEISPTDEAAVFDPSISQPSDPDSVLVTAPPGLEAESDPMSPQPREFSPLSQRSGNKFASAHSLRPTVHRSFILQYNSDQLAKQWCLIDRDFFLAVKFEELTLEDQEWKQLRMRPDVTDWSLYMKERMKMKLEATVNPEVKTPTSITTSRLRFNLMVNFVASEVVLTAPHERIDVVSKFIRTAWKSYTFNNYHAVVAIMTGLQTRWVVQALGRAGSKLGMWESRLFADLQIFTSQTNDFLLLRQSMANLAPSAAASRAGDSVAKQTSAETQAAGHVPGCVPFVGVYLSQLFRHNQLPQYIDPSSPRDPVAPHSTEEDLCRPEIFQDLKPIPPFMSVGPLLNVHKQRLIASIIKSLVTGQHLASRVSHPVDQKLYWKCMRLKCLDVKMLDQLSQRKDY